MLYSSGQTSSNQNQQETKNIGSAKDVLRKKVNFSPQKKKPRSKRRRKKSKFGGEKSVLETLEEEELLKEKDRLLKEELAKLDPKKAPTKQDSSFYPPPPNLEKRRCYFHKGARALKCTVCSGGIELIIVSMANIRVSF